MSSNVQQRKLSTEGFLRGTGRQLVLELLLAPLEVLEVRLEHLVAMRFLEGEATQSCHQCLEDQAATECNVVIETCRRLIQVKIFLGFDWVGNIPLLTLFVDLIWESLVDEIILYSHFEMCRRFGTEVV